MVELHGYSSTINKTIIDKLKQNMFKLTAIEVDSCKEWTGMRPVTSDDVPVISQLPFYQNAYVNTGHGSRGMIQSFGSAILLNQIIQQCEIQTVNK